MKNIIERMEEEKTAEKIARFRINQQLPYEQKVAYAAKRSEEFYLECQRRGLSCHRAPILSESEMEMLDAKD